MKKILLTAFIALMGTAVLAADFGNYSSRRHPRNEGFFLRMEGFYSSSYYIYCSPSIAFAIGDQINPYLMIGGGIGWLTFNDYYYGYYGNFGYAPNYYGGYYDCVPVYFNTRVYPLNSEWSPYLDLKLGMDCYSWGYYYNPVFFSFGVGASWRNLDFGGAINTMSNNLFYTLNISYNFRF